MSRWLKRVVLALVAVLVFIGNTVIAAGPLMTAINYLGYWTYPMSFIVNLLLTALVLQVLLPSNPEVAKRRSKKFYRSVAWLKLLYLKSHRRENEKNFWLRISGMGAYVLFVFLMWLKGVLMPKEETVKDSWVWKVSHGRGAFVTLFVGTWLISPMIGAWSARYLKLEPVRTWKLMLWSVSLTTAINVSLALGAWDVIMQIIL